MLWVEQTLYILNLGIEASTLYWCAIDVTHKRITVT